MTTADMTSAEVLSTPDHVRILALFRDGPADARAAFVDSCPAHPLRDAAAALARSDRVVTRVCALGVLATGYCHGRACQLGAEIALAGHDLGAEALRDGHTDLQAATLSGLAVAAVNALQQLGRNTDALAACERLLRLHEKLDPADVNVDSLRMAQVEILLDMNRVDDAQEAFAAAPPARGAAAVAAAHLGDRLAADRQPATELPQGGPHPPTPAELERARIARELAERMGPQLGGGDELNEQEASARLRRASAFLTDPVAGHDPARLEAAVLALQTLRDFTQRHASPLLDCDTLWTLAICLRRLGRLAEAVRVMQALRRHVEDLRVGIRDPLERAGAGSRFPYLYPSLCQTLTQLGRAAELLDAMEGAKGRAVADVLAGRGDHVVGDRELSRPAEALPALLRREQAHYLSFFVDDDETYAAVVAKDGKVYAAPAIPLGRGAIRGVAQGLDAARWTREWSPGGALAPLLSWLEPLMDAGVMDEGDHLIWSPDESLHEIPLHAVDFRGAPAVQTFGMSRAHGARSLVLALEQRPARPGRYVSIEVPARTDLDSDAMRAELARIGEWLSASGLRGVPILHEKASLDQLAATDLSRSVVHFATHGTFPAVNETGPLANPFRGSGLLLAAGGLLPDRDRLWTVRGGSASILTPERILDARLDFSGSHVSLAACVSGLAREGAGGDALGLDWALVLAGAASILSTHWTVDARHVARFMERFYDAWLRRALSRSAAWRDTVLGLRRETGGLGNARCWAAFTLSGDWR